MRRSVDLKHSIWSNYDAWLNNTRPIRKIGRSSDYHAFFDTVPERPVVCCYVGRKRTGVLDIGTVHPAIDKG